MIVVLLIPAPVYCGSPPIVQNFRLKNAVKMANTVVVRCDPQQGEMLYKVAELFCSDAVPQIQQAILLR
jgi:hypothetical protein